jgi:4'-phosphopantetheinyl transferase
MTGARIDAEGLQVEVFSVRLNGSASHARPMSELLSEEERLRAQKFKFAHITDLFVQAHAALRILAARKLRVEPGSIVFSTGSFGKPRIDRAPDFGFNLSHSGNMAVIAFASGCDVGVDVEQIRELSDFDEIIQRYFSIAEIAEFRSVERGFRKEAFFSAWTRKEAYIKAKGEGLSIPLDSFSVSLRPGAAPTLTVPCGPGSGEEWQIEELKPAPGYVGALVYSGERRPVSVYETLDMDSLWSSSR